MAKTTIEDLLDRMIVAVEYLSIMSEKMDKRLRKVENDADKPATTFHILAGSVDKLTNKVEDLRKAGELAREERQLRRLQVERQIREVEGK